MENFLPPPIHSFFQLIKLYYCIKFPVSIIDKKKISRNRQRFFSSLTFFVRVSNLTYLKKYKCIETIESKPHLNISTISKSTFGGISIYTGFRPVEKENKTTVCPTSPLDFEWNVTIHERARVFGPSRRENKTRRRDFNGTNGHGNFAHRESDEERFEKLGRLLLTNEASLIENCLKLPLLITITRVATVVSNSIRESYNVIDTQNDFLYRVKRKLAQQIKYQLETVDRFARRFALSCPPF